MSCSSPCPPSPSQYTPPPFLRTMGKTSYLLSWLISDTVPQSANRETGYALQGNSWRMCKKIVKKNKEEKGEKISGQGTVSRGRPDFSRAQEGLTRVTAGWWQGGHWCHLCCLSLEIAQQDEGDASVGCMLSKSLKVLPGRGRNRLTAQLHPNRGTAQLEEPQVTPFTHHHSGFPSRLKSHEKWNLGQKWGYFSQVRRCKMMPQLFHVLLQEE